MPRAKAPGISIFSIKYIWLYKLYRSCVGGAGGGRPAETAVSRGGIDRDWFRPSG